MKLLAHRSPLALEAELCDRVADAKRTDPLARVLVIVPTRRLAEHVSRRLVERAACILGVEVLPHHALPWRILEAAGRPAPAALSDPLRDALLARVLREAPRGALRDFARGRPGAFAALRETLEDLREAGIEPRLAADALRGPEAEVAGLYARWACELERIERSGRAADAAGLARMAVPHAAAFASPFAAILHHGAYDLIGVRVELLRALDGGREIAFLLPADPENSAGRFGRDRGRRIAESAAAPLGRPVPAPAVSHARAPGARAEVKHAVYEALAAVERGVPPHEVAIVLRSFAPYAAAIDALVDAERPAWNTSYLLPLRRDPWVAAASLALEDAEDAGDLPPSRHAERLDRIARAAIADARRESAPARALAAAIATLAERETVLGDAAAIPHEEALAWVRSRLDAATIAPAGAEGGGIRLLDAMQARGLTFRRLALVGMNAGLFPRSPREDPFLRDAARRRLREASGQPLPLAAETESEERLLLTMLLGAARDEVALSWRSADDAGRPLLPARALRPAEGAARTLPLAPRELLAAWADDPGVLSPGDELILAALASESGGDGVPAVSRRRPDLSDGAALVAATDSFAPGSGRYDGRVGPAVARSRLAASALERLGRCPLRFFLQDVLRVEAVPTPPTPFESDLAAVGRRVHDVLNEVLGELLARGAFEALDLPARVALAREVLARVWRDRAGADAAARAERLPGLSRIEDARWSAALGSFLAADLARMADEGLVPEALEHPIEALLPGGPATIAVRARLDRVLRGSQGQVVGDYKTGGDLALRTRPAEMLSGKELQVAIYALLTGFPVELLGVGPRHAAETGEETDARFVRFEGFDKTALRDGVVETLGAVLALASSGRFPIRAGSHCGFCDYASACRKGHPPTEYREEQAEDIADARDCWGKKVKSPSLSSVRAGRA
ncbi:MAG TPA: PD-(D/E)XK nuclease family protein [Candidatus Polarisedimenticolaceae bacterium]|nr:PD-(D/E)XK nuclease family protein [Candidatus Polarisedimenticolaceae bacterium]